jgi:hypothetical protein
LVWREHTYAITVRREVDVRRLARIDPNTVSMVRKRMGAALFRLKQRGIAEEAAAGGLGLRPLKPHDTLPGANLGAPQRLKRVSA